MTWTDEQVESLKAMWADGMSCNEIAAALGNGISRNAVIGKVHRLDLPERARTKADSASLGGRNARAAMRRKPLNAVGIGVGGMIKARAAIMRTERPAPAPRPIEDMEVPVSRRLSLLDLTGKTCKYADGGLFDPPKTFCGNGTFGNLPYCEYHSRIAYVPVDRRRSERRAAVA